MIQSTTSEIGERAFGQDDQRLFALVSSDCNPLHMDPLAARRLATGRQAVHGIHILLTAIELWRNDSGAAPVSIRCSFDNLVSVGDTVVFTQRDRDAHHVVIQAAVNGLPCAKIAIATVQDGRPDAGSSQDESSAEPRRADGLRSPLEEAPEAHVGRTYAVTPNDADFPQAFPVSSRYLGTGRVAALSALSYFVGMICPGLHSMLSGLSVDLSVRPGSDGTLVFTVRSYDPRFRLFDIGFQGIVRGRIETFARLPPQEQPSLNEVAAQVSPEEFRGTRSLVIGGSRGLGELTAKILASGGGHVVITYASGFDEARRIRDEINDGGRSTAEILKLDLTVDSFDSMKIDYDDVDAVYYFATPRIFRQQASVFEPSVFHEFSDFYIKKFYELCVHLEARAAATRIKVFFPSTVAVSERPKGMTEYSMAKAAAEVLTEEINRTFKRVSVLSTRLPRLSTDQTSTLLQVQAASNLETLLPIVRSLNKVA